MKGPLIRLLLVDDNPIDAALAQGLIASLSQELPIETHWVDSAEEALAEVRRHAYDLMVLDYQLPGSSGLQVLAETQKLPELQRPAVIMLTASGSERVAVEAMKMGARDYLRKDELAAAPLTRALFSALTQKTLEDKVARYLAQTQEDLRMARQLQHAMLTQRFPSFPASAEAAESSLRFHARYVSTAELGGDFYEVLSLSDHAAGVFICDVMGHGVRAALVTAMIRALVEEERAHAADPEGFLNGINHGLSAILKDMEDPLFATAFYLVADVAQGTIRFVNAGHPQPIHLRRRDGGVVLLQSDEHLFPALGLVDTAVYMAASATVEPGDLLLLYTDGLIEMDSPGDEEYGVDRLVAAIRQQHHLPPGQLLDALLADVRAFAGGREFFDDVCLVGIEVAVPAAKDPAHES